MINYFFASRFGLSDLHGDGRVHEVSGDDGLSGFGFELAFRLRREPGETAPPTWPAALLQSLGKYVFQSGKYHYTTLKRNNLLGPIGIFMNFLIPRKYVMRR
jgi:hypothetical protein